MYDFLSENDIVHFIHQGTISLHSHKCCCRPLIVVFYLAEVLAL